MSVHVYHGPTVAADTIRQALPAAHLHPPIKHGDLMRLDVVPGDTVLIIDGLFHSAAAVRHKEVLHLLANGVHVVGASSMGALRAAELHPYGMVGIGWVFAAYRDGIIEADDEVAVTHTTDDFRQAVEPLVNIRYTLDAAVGDGVIASCAAAAVLEAARGLPYPARTWRLLRRTTASVRPDLTEQFDRLIAWRDGRSTELDIKHQDALEALRAVAAGTVVHPDTSGWAQGSWGNFYLHEWLARYRGAPVGDTYVPFIMECHHQQLYDPDFPRRWRLHTLRWIAGDDRATLEEAADRAAAVTAANGLTPRDVDGERLSYWLSPAERSGLPEREQLLRAMVRARWRSAIRPARWADAPDLLNPDIPSVRIAAAAHRFNKQVASGGPHRTVHHLRAERVRAHLAQTWGVPADDFEELTAAARDRLFDSLDGAVDAARPFYLWATYQKGSLPTAPADRAATR